MTQQQFPSIQPVSGESYLALSGMLTYTPWVNFSTDIMNKLQQVLEPICDLDGCENPEVIADWRECVRSHVPSPTITHRSDIILYRDGSDYTEEEEDGHTRGIAVLFCRKDIDQTTSPHTVTYRVHIPQRSAQILLLNACDFVGELKAGGISQMDTIRIYLNLIINNQGKWTPLEELLLELVDDTIEEEED